MINQVQTADSAAVNRLCLQRDTLISDTDKKVISKAYPILMALGGLLALGGLFTLLAACQVLPAGANLISGLGFPMKVVSVTAVVGGAISVVGLLVFYASMKRSVESSNSVYRWAARDNRLKWVNARLRENEIFIVEDREDKEYIVYGKGTMPTQEETAEMLGTAPCTSWARKDLTSDLIKETQGQVVVTLEDLRNRQPQL